jgi:hypothetical protein
MDTREPVYGTRPRRRHPDVSPRSITIVPLYKLLRKLVMCAL